MAELQEQVDLSGALKSIFGYNKFRGQQEAIMANIISGKNTFVIMPTGAGKSLCYQLPAIVTEGTALVISPLIALMKNQVDQLKALGINANFLNSTLSKSELSRVRSEVFSGETKLLYVAPESLTKPENLELLNKSRINFVAIDEAHCISEWGHDFRPEYRRIKTILQELGNLPIIALTATATPKVQADIQRNLQMENADVFKSSFNRTNLYYEVRPKKETKKALIKFINKFPRKSGIIYCLSRKKVEEISEFLNLNGISSLPYHAGLDSSVRVHNQDAFLNERVDVIVATIAFGMGIDKPDVRFVIHYDTPKSLEGYYQETGRAGRDGLEARCLMFYSYADIEKLDKFNKDKGVKERENARMLLQEMVGYAESSLCRRRQILNYFGEVYEKDCGYCDNCFRDRESTTIKEDAELVLRTVKATEERFSNEHLIQVIMGIKSSYSESYGHEKLKEFGEGKDKDQHYWTNVFRHLRVYQLLEKDIDNQLYLKLTKTGESYLLTPTELTLYQDIDYENDPGFDEKQSDSDNGPEIKHEEEDELFNLLLELRKKKAEEMALPPYAVFQETSLREMAHLMPQSKEQMSLITGVGQGKIKKFSQPFIDLIKKYAEDHDIELENQLVIKSSVSKSRLKIFIIQQIDRKIDLEEIADTKNIKLDELLVEIENIVQSGTRLDLDYYLESVMDEETIEELFDYFYEAETDDLEAAYEDLVDDGFTEEEIRLVRLKFLSEVAN